MLVLSREKENPVHVQVSYVDLQMLHLIYGESSIVRNETIYKIDI